MPRSYAEPRQVVTVVQGTLTSLGSAPFHLKAEITDGTDPSLSGTVEMFWLDPLHWRRVISSPDFSQTMVVDGEKVSEQDSARYFPLGLWSIVTAMIDPDPIVTKLRPADQVRTKANGLASESGVSCFDANHRMCMKNPWGLDEFVGGAGHSIEFNDYRPFGNKRIARRLVYQVSPGDFMTARVTSLEDLRHPDRNLFTVDHPTDPSDRIRIVALDQASLMDLATQKSEIIWPQVLDGNVKGSASFYISLDTTGTIREVQPLRTDNERSNDSAIRQIERWKFKPPVVDGVPAQVEGVLTFDLDTRAFGPRDFLNDSEGRKLATNIVDPVVPKGSVAPGTVFRIWVAVDSDGIIIEEIVLDGPSDLFTACDRALHQWHFQPILENGQSRPYRTLIEFRF